MDLIKNIKFAMKDIFKNEEQLQMTAELREQLIHVTDNIDQMKSIISDFFDSNNDKLDNIRELLSEQLNINWFLQKNNEALNVIKTGIGDLSEEIKKYNEEDYLEEQRENTKIYQSTITNKLLKNILDEMKLTRIGINGLKLSGNDGGLLGGLLGGVGGGLLGGLGKMLGIGAGVGGVKMLGKGKTALKLLKIVKTGATLAKAATASTGIGLALVVADEAFGISDKIIDSLFEMFTGIEVEEKQKTIMQKLFGVKKKISDITPEFLKNHPALKLSDYIWEQVADVTGYTSELEDDMEDQQKKNDRNLITVMGQLSDFFTKYTPMDMMYKLYTDKEGFNQMLNELNGIFLGNQLDVLNEINPVELEEKQEKQIQEKMKEIKNRALTDNQYKGEHEDELYLRDAALAELQEEAKKVQLIEQSEDGSKVRAKAPERPKKSSLDKMINEAANKHGIEPALLKGMIETESSFRHDVVSHTGNVGYTQMSPGAAEAVGMDWEEIKADPQKNIEGGAAYLSQLLKRFGGNKELALAAYNAGPTRVAKLGRIPNIKETQEYVPKVLSNYEKYKTERLVNTEKQQQVTNPLRILSMLDLPQNDTPQNNIINNINENNSTIESDQNITKLNPNSPFELHYAKLFMNPNFVV